jgi:glycosyltransferase involved in cell wall biosynthesis
LRVIGIQIPGDAQARIGRYCPPQMGALRPASRTSREELRTLLRQTTMLVLPSLEDNCPMTVLEAMGASVPVVAARVAGLPDLIEDRRTCFFCDPLQATSMAVAVEKVVTDPAEAADVAHLARQCARDRFRPKVIGRRHPEIYREVLGRNVGSPIQNFRRMATPMSHRITRGFMVIL